MHDSTESSDRSWLLLIHQLPPKPDYLRVKVRRRLHRLGALPLKNSVYVLPNRPESAEDFEWLRAEIEGDGGDATVVEASLVGGVTDDDLESLFRAERDAEYAEIARAARESTEQLDVIRLRRRLEEAGKTDFFGAAGRDEAERAIDALEVRTTQSAKHARSDPHGAPDVLGTTWVTRAGVFVDRIASAWLIRRFIDPKATFKFVPGKSYRPRERELRFDMYEGEYTHEGDHCTFETLLARFGLGGDAALQTIAEIVHDIDLKDEKFGRDETTGVAAVLTGIARTIPDDLERLQQGSALFDGLYAQLRDANA
jgi:hypothetical protein